MRRCWNCGVAGHARYECKGPLINRGYDYAPQKRSMVYSVESEYMEDNDADEHWELEEDSAMEWPKPAVPRSRGSSVKSLP